MRAVYRRVWTVVAILVGGFGLAEAVTAVNVNLVVAAALVGGMTAGGAYLACSPVEDKTWAHTRGPVAAAGALGLATGPALAGLVVLAGWPAVMLVLALVATSPAALAVGSTATRSVSRWLFPSRGDHTTAGHDRPPDTHEVADRRQAPFLVRHAGTRLARPAPPAPERPAPPFLPDAAQIGQMDTAELCWQWRVSFTRLARLGADVDLGRRLALVSLRQAYLDEMGLRDPAGFSRWLRAGARPASDPSRYIVAGSTPPSPEPASG